MVHHAGYYTLKHLKTSPVAQDILNRAFKDCVVIGTEDYQEVSDFLFEMAMKVARTTVEGFNRKWKASGTVENHPAEALQQLLTGIWDNLDEISPP